MLNAGTYRVPSRARAGVWSTFPMVWNVHLTDGGEEQGAEHGLEMSNAVRFFTGAPLAAMAANVPM